MPPEAKAAVEGDATVNLLVIDIVVRSEVVVGNTLTEEQVLVVCTYYAFIVSIIDHIAEPSIRG